MNEYRERFIMSEYRERFIDGAFNVLCDIYYNEYGCPACPFNEYRLSHGNYCDELSLEEKYTLIKAYINDEI